MRRAAWLGTGLRILLLVALVRVIQRLGHTERGPGRAEKRLDGQHPRGVPAAALARDQTRAGPSGSLRDAAPVEVVSSALGADAAWRSETAASLLSDGQRRALRMGGASLIVTVT